MIAYSTAPASATVKRARQSRGVSSDAVHRMVSASTFITSAAVCP